MARATRRLTIRLPQNLHQACTELAKRRGVSLDALVQEALTTTLKAEEYDRLYEEFGLLGEDPKECDVEFAAPAQWEVVRRGDDLP